MCCLRPSWLPRCHWWVEDRLRLISSRYRILLMRRIFAILLICLLPLQSFAGAGMGVKMAGMTVQMADAPQAPCHEASQPMQAATQDCCDLQGICQSLCHLSAGLPLSNALTLADLSHHVPHQMSARFQSADLRMAVRPPLL